MSDTSPAPRNRRVVRSFVRREGRLTSGQRRALDELLPRYGLAPTGAPFDLAAAFGRRSPVVMDIGFGDGESLASMAIHNPQRDYLGVEVYRPGIGRLLRRLEDEGIDNVRVAVGDAVEVLRRNIEPGSLAGVQLFFPDPWPKKRHHKRRIVQPAWLALVAERLLPGGFLHMATDWHDYAEHMMAVVEASSAFDNAYGAGGFASARSGRPRTRFERRAAGKGHGVWDLVLVRPGDDER